MTALPPPIAAGGKAVDLIVSNLTGTKLFT